jgi:hypothetical protein
MPESTPTPRPLQAPGALVSQRLAHWRSLTWDELEHLMRMPESQGARPETESLTAPPARARLVRE